jgi:ubiquinol-cytochrome c reductase cytochrome c1 subunit
MLRKLTLAAFGLALLAGPALAATTQKEPIDPPGRWGWTGPFGKFDKAQLQRGYKVYREVCAACHSMEQVYFRTLGQPGGPFFDPKYGNPNNNPVVKSLAHDIQIKDIDSDTGDTISRPGLPSDKFPDPFANAIAAAASNGGAAPPDLSVMAKAREGGPSYVYSLVGRGFVQPPAGLTVPPGKYYNAYYPGDLTANWHGKGPPPEGGLISMPPPLTPNKVTFDDGTPSTVQNEARDVAAFLAWTAEPKQEERKAFGLGAMIYLLIFTGLIYLSYKRVWKNVEH